jgi:hypothetical protein
MRTTFRTFGAVCLAGALSAAQAATARPGAVNYIEGQVSIDGRTLDGRSLQSTEVEPGQVLRTEQGKAEMLLTPGVFLRLGGQASVRMVSPSLTDTRVELLQGEAMLEADEVLPGNHLVVADHGADTLIQKQGLYKFTADPAQLAVYDGKAEVFADDRTAEVGKGKTVTLAAQASMKPQSFDNHLGDDLYQWSSVRSQYVAEANQSSVQAIVVGSPYPFGWYGMGWYWNPWFSTWAFIPANGFFASPFGFGFYSPVYWRAYPPARYFVRPGVVASTAAVRAAAPAMRAGAPAMMRAPMGAMRGGGRR